MSNSGRIPSYRSLDIYRLVVARRFKQQEVAQSFGLTPQRVCQIVRRVRQWVNASIAEWLFPRRDDLRFYVALDCEHIRPYELPDEPETVLLVGPGWSYSRHDGAVNELDNWRPGSTIEGGLTRPQPRTPDPSSQLELNLSVQPGNSAAAHPGGPLAATSCDDADCASPATTELAHSLAQLLTRWKKLRKVESASKRPLRRGLQLNPISSPAGSDA